MQALLLLHNASWYIIWHNIWCAFGNKYPLEIWKQ
jgi:hypothetical protein